MFYDGMLSQDEIDALLNGTDDTQDNDVAEEEFESELTLSDYMSDMEVDAIGEIGNISFGSSATALSALLNQKVDITTPTVSLIDVKKLEEQFPDPYVAINVNYTVGFSGVNLLVIKQADAAIIADLMLGGDGTNPPELIGEIQLSAVQEAMNQMMGSSATSMSTIFNKKVDISPPAAFIFDAKESSLSELANQDVILKVSFRLTVGNLIDSNIMQLYPVSFAKALVKELMETSTKVTEAAPSTVETTPNIEKKMEVSAMESNQTSVQVPSQSSNVHNAVRSESAQLTTMSKQMVNPVDVQPVQFASFETSKLQESEAHNLDLLLDIPLQVTVELGRTKRTVKEVLELSPGSIVELDKLAGEPVDILVNNRLMAQGEVVVIDENFGVRVTNILSRTERLKKLK